MKDYYLYCESCGIITGKLHGFKLVTIEKKNHIKKHQEDGTRWEFMMVRDWGK